jgi:Tol biopolymer transport system component
LKGAIRERALFGAFLLGLAAAACDNTALVGAELPKTDSGQGNMINLAGSGGATGGLAGADAGVVGATGGVAGTGAGVAGTDAGIFLAGDSGGTGTPMPGPWLFFDSLRGLNRDIYAIRADGTSLKRMTTSPATEQEPSVSRDGTTLAFSSDADGTFQIYLMPLPAGAVRPLTHHAEGAQQPSWSPDGKQLVFFSNMGLSIIGSDGQNDHPVVVVNGNGNSPAEHAVFAPSGRALLFDSVTQIDQLDLDTGLTSIDYSFTTTMEHPSVSPDGRSIAYNAWCDSTGYSIWILPLAPTPDMGPCSGTRVTTPAEGPGRVPSISPDGLIAFERGTGAARIGIVKPGGAVMDVTHGESDDRNPTWSPVSLVLP